MSGRSRAALPKLAILIPSAYRRNELVRCVNSLILSEDWDYLPLDATIVVSPVEDDESTLDYITINRDNLAEIVRTKEEYTRGAIYGWNTCLLRAHEADLFVLAADDLVFHTNWLTFALDELNRMGGSGLVGFNDMSSDGTVYAGHWLADRDFIIKHLGGVMYPPMYKSWWCDRETTDIAQGEGLYAWSARSMVEHYNYGFRKSQVDRTYREAMPNYDSDEKLYRARKLAGFPKDYDPILR